MHWNAEQAAAPVVATGAPPEVDPSSAHLIMYRGLMLNNIRRYRLVRLSALYAGQTASLLGRNSHVSASRYARTSDVILGTQRRW